MTVDLLAPVDDFKVKTKKKSKKSADKKSGKGKKK